MLRTTYSQARAKFAELWDRVVADRETVIIKRRGAEDVALVAADELANLRETAYLLRSPENATRLLAALADARAGVGRRLSLEELRREVGLESQT